MSDKPGINGTTFTIKLEKDWFQKTNIIKMTKENSVFFDTIRAIAIERYEQLTKHNRSIYDDVIQNSDNQLAEAATVLLLDDATLDTFSDAEKVRIFKPSGWDDIVWLRMINKPYKQRCIISATLIAAEVDRLNYIENEA